MKVDPLAVLEHLPVAVMVLNAMTKNVLLLNRKFTELFGYSLKDITNERDWWPRAFPDSRYRDHVCREWDRRIHYAHLSNVEMQPLEAVALCADGSQCHIRKHYAAMNNLEIVTLVDISDQKFLQRQYEDLAATDTLTGLPNRRSFFFQLEKWLSLASRHNRPLAVLLADIDHFKQVNDSHGHQTGDAVLSHFAVILSRGLRGSDLAARIGGEEFALILPETGTEGALTMAERLRQDVEATVFRNGSLEIPITVSFGLACLPDPSSSKRTTCDDMLHLADDALYTAKREGRNQVRMRKIDAP